MLTSLSVDEILLPRYVNWSTNLSGNGSFLFKTHKFCFICVHIEANAPGFVIEIPLEQMYLYIYIYIDWLICLVGRVFANGPGDLCSIPGRVIPKTFKMVLDTLSDIRYVSMVKWSSPGKGVAPSPTPRCCSYWKGSLLVALDYSR